MVKFNVGTRTCTKIQNLSSFSPHISTCCLFTLGAVGFQCHLLHYIWPEITDITANIDSGKKLHHQAKPMMNYDIYGCGHVCPFPHGSMVFSQVVLGAVAGLKRFKRCQRSTFMVSNKPRFWEWLSGICLSVYTITVTATWKGWNMSKVDHTKFWWIQNQHTIIWRKKNGLPWTEAIKRHLLLHVCDI